MMSIADVVSRVTELESLAQRAVGGDARPASSVTAQSSAQSFAAALALADGALPSGGLAVAPPSVSPMALQEVTNPVTGAGDGARVLAAAESQVGQMEQPPGSNDGPAIAAYRSAVADAQPGEPWCAYFASWAARQAGVPLGDAGQGFGSVAGITDWAVRTGRYLPPTATPQPGDLILFGDRHVGIVESVNPGGTLTTVEGNYDSAVNRVQRSPAEATGYVRL